MYFFLLLFFGSISGAFFRFPRRPARLTRKPTRTAFFFEASSDPETANHFLVEIPEPLFFLFRCWELPERHFIQAFRNLLIRIFLWKPPDGIFKNTVFPPISEWQMCVWFGGNTFWTFLLTFIRHGFHSGTPFFRPVSAPHPSATYTPVIHQRASQILLNLTDAFLHSTNRSDAKSERFAGDRFSSVRFRV